MLSSLTGIILADILLILSWPTSFSSTRSMVNFVGFGALKDRERKFRDPYLFLLKSSAGQVRLLIYLPRQILGCPGKNAEV